MTGAPASGKSTTAAEVARRLGAAVLDLDSMTNPLVDIVASATGASDYGDPTVADLTRDARYECLTRVARDCLEAGVSVVLIAPFTAERKDSAAWERLAARLETGGGLVRLAWIRVTEELLVERIVARGAARDADKIAGLRDYVASVDLTPPRTSHIELDGAASPESQAATVVTALARGADPRT